MSHCSVTKTTYFGSSSSPRSTSYCIELNVGKVKAKWESTRKVVSETDPRTGKTVTRSSHQVIKEVQRGKERTIEVLPFLPLVRPKDLLDIYRSSSKKQLALPAPQASQSQPKVLPPVPPKVATPLLQRKPIAPTATKTEASVELRRQDSLPLPRRRAAPKVRSTPSLRSASFAATLAPPPTNEEMDERTRRRLRRQAIRDAQEEQELDGDLV